ncbi:MAG: hypothetical protein AAF740_10315 [Bacteroidota bacterium]
MQTFEIKKPVFLSDRLDLITQDWFERIPFEINDWVSDLLSECFASVQENQINMPDSDTEVTLAQLKRVNRTLNSHFKSISLIKVPDGFQDIIKRNTLKQYPGAKQLWK